MSRRIRIRFAKLGKIRWISHRDVARAWERAFRRVELPLAYTGGFSPRPKVSFGLALPTGYESVAEYLDVETVDSDLDVSALPARLSAALPEGMEVTAARWLEPGTSSLQEDVASCSWRWTVASVSSTDPVDGTELRDSVARLVNSPSAVVTRSRKGQPVTEDVRAGILDLHVVEGDGVWLEAELACKPRGLRPTDVMAALDLGLGGPGGEGGRDGPGGEEGRLEERDVQRTHQWMWRDGARQEPLSADGAAGATGAPHALERAS